MNEPTVMAVDAATTLFNLPGYRVISTTITADGCRQVMVETPAGARVLCQTRGKKSELVVGDHVLWQTTGDSGVIDSLVRGCRSLNPRPKSHPGHAPQVDSGTTWWMR